MPRGSSGQNVRHDIAQEACECGYEGLVDVEFDAELHTRRWDCPECVREYEEPVD